MKLVIVESPTKARTLSRYLGKDFEIEASMGHIRDLPKSRLSIDVEKDFKPTYELAKGKGQVVKKLQNAAKKADKVILAMDPDREGEAIAYHVKYVINSSVKKKENGKKFERVTFHEITKAAIEAAMTKPHGIDLKLVHAQQARRVVDRLVGYSLSPVLWKKVRRGLSAGRVQSVALRLVVEREEEIDAFVPVEYWEIRARLKRKLKIADNEEFEATVVEIEGKRAKKGEFLITEGKIAKEVAADLKESKYTIVALERKEKKSTSFPPFTTSTLQQAAANVLGWTARQTMQVAQKLYEGGKITYHRTDSFNLSSSAVESARKYIKTEFGPDYLPEKPRVFRTKSKSAQEAHEAIRPTKITDGKLISEGNGKLTDRHAKLYKLIWKRMVASQMSAAVYDATVADIEAGNNKNKKDYLLKAKGSVRKFDGWRRLYKRSVEDVVLPELIKGEELGCKDIFSDQKFTQPPARYNDASLVKALEERGIGRPSTYAPIISTIIFRGYVERKEKRFFPTSVGVSVVNFLKKHFKKIMDYDFTAGMEEDLDSIALGEKKWVPVVKSFWEPFDKQVKTVEKTAKRVTIPVEKTGKKCPDCDEGEIVIRTGRFGKFYSCNRFPECKYKATYREKVEGMKCLECKEGDVVVKRTRKGRMFYGCSRYPDCEWASWTKPKKD